MSRAIRLVAVLMLGLAALAPPMSAHAEGPGIGGRRVRLDGEIAGPFRVRVVTSPTPVVVETLYLEVRVEDVSTGEVLTDAVVMTRAIALEGQGASLEAEATHDIAPIPTEYASHLPVPATGVWQIEVEIEHALGRGTVSFRERVTSPSSLGGVLSVGLPIAGFALLIVVFLWLQRTSPR